MNIKWKNIGHDLLVFTVTLLGALVVCDLLSGINEDNNPFATSLFILAVAVIARFTTGYAYGIAASILGVLAVNYFFTAPFWAFSLGGAGYPLTFAAMLLVSVIVSALATRVKKQERLRYEVETQKMRADLLRSVSHDLRTPLASILGVSSTLRDDTELSAFERDELLAEIQKEALWLTRITENILSITKFSGEAVCLKKNEEVVEEIVGSAIVKFHHNAEFPVRVIRPEEILLAPMDATLIEQVLINLMENAVAHAEGATCIELELRGEKDRVIVTVADDGAGIPPELMEHLFDGRASMLRRTHADERRGMGLGLTVCHSIIKAHGGELTAQNRPQGGAAFSFWLPQEGDPTNETAG